MTDAEIKKDLLFVAHYCHDEYNEIRVDVLLLEALDLINRQQADNKRLKKLLEEADVNYNKCAKRFYKEGVKEFAERVKMAFYYEFDEIIPSIMADNIDNLVKEMVGD